MNGSEIDQASGDDVTLLSRYLRQALQDIRAIMGERSPADEQNHRIAQIAARLGRNASAQGIAADSLLIATRIAWEREIAPVLIAGGEDAESSRMRAMGALLEAYFLEGP